MLNSEAWARESGLTTSLDTAWTSRGGWLATIEPCLPYIDIFMPSFEEAKMIARRDEPGDFGGFGDFGDVADFLGSPSAATVSRCSEAWP